MQKNKNRFIIWDWKESYPAEEIHDLLEEWGEGARVYHLESHSDFHLAIVSNDDQEAIDAQIFWDDELDKAVEENSKNAGEPCPPCEADDIF